MKPVNEMSVEEMEIEVAERVMGARWVTSCSSRQSHCLQPAEKVDEYSPSHVFTRETLPAGHTARAFWEPPHYLRDPAADYSVLEKVRKTFNREQFGMMLNAITSIYCDRFVKHTGALRPDENSRRVFLLYEPGDYSKAALSCIRASRQEEKTNASRPC